MSAAQTQNQNATTKRKSKVVATIGPRVETDNTAVAVQTPVTSDANLTVKKQRRKKNDTLADIAPPISCDEIFGPEAQRSGTLGKIETPKEKETQAVAEFRKLLVLGRSKGKGYRTALNDTLLCAYMSLYAYRETPWSATRDEMWKVMVEMAHGEFEMPKRGKKVEHVIVQLAFGELSMATKSQRARLLRLAYSENEGRIKPSEFLAWLERKGGIVKALKAPTANSSEVAKLEAQKRKDDARKKVYGASFGKVENVKVQGLAPIVGKALALAIIERDADGKFVIRGFTDNEYALDTACHAYAKAVA
ncbi:hypothetical protein [Caballeronia zhejiangensis]|uniref:hypothetical protein n=1 Tax=Caballeronia zhejiangensis TaxID=871203 RepID=UPI001F51E180|nr:hypothetical protein [Caballeronia zhejiangensis]MCI1046912.1 hypothetical protein [Caballeronia zhejiangensis]